MAAVVAVRARSARTQARIAREANGEDLSRFSFIEEQAKDREEKLIVSRIEDGIKVSALPVDLTPEVQREFFEKGWGSYLIKEG